MLDHPALWIQQAKAEGINDSLTGDKTLNLFSPFRKNQIRRCA
jgi:hypothetical protein